MKRLLIIFYLLLIFCLLPTKTVLAVSVGVKPKELNLEVTAGKKAETEILIINTGQEPAFYKVYPDNFKNKIIIKPSDFRLNPGDSQIVNANIKLS